MRLIETVDFDNIDCWAPNLTVVLRSVVTDSVIERLAGAKFEFIEDALDFLFTLTDSDAVTDAVLAWITSVNIMGYHGTRLTDEEVTSIKNNGLLPLEAKLRRNRLARALSFHPKWSEVADRLDAVIEAYGKNNRAGNREGQVHLTLSKAGLVHGFNHYLAFGSEFDQRVAQYLLGEEGKKLLSLYGKPRIIEIALPGNLALGAAHPYFGIDDMRRKGDVPNLVNEFLKAWSYRISNPNFQSRKLEIDCGMIFYKTIPANWIVNVKTLEDFHNERC